jgi:hypothetical protein
MAARGEEMIFNCTCPKCLHHIQITASKSGFPLHTCPDCGHQFTAWEVYSSITPAVESVVALVARSADCLENPKSHRHPDWIEQWEALELRNWLDPVNPW